MIFRKLRSAWYTSILAVSLLLFMESVTIWDEDFISMCLIFLTYTVPVIFIYGSLSSVISEIISSKRKRHVFMSSLLLHILFGFAFILPYGLYFESLPFLNMNMAEILFNPVAMLSVFFAVVYFLIDYILQTKFNKEISYEE